MTHLEQFEALLSDANIGAIQQITANENGTAIVLKNSGKYGYTGFFSAWEFDSTGKLLSVSHWE